MKNVRNCPKKRKNGQRPISAFCNLHLLNFAQGYLTKLNFEMCSIIWSVTPFGIFSKKSTFPTFMFFTPPYCTYCITYRQDLSLNVPSVSSVHILWCKHSFPLLFLLNLLSLLYTFYYRLLGKPSNTTLRILSPQIHNLFFGPKSGVF